MLTSGVFFPAPEIDCINLKKKKKRLAMKRLVAGWNGKAPPSSGPCAVLAPLCPAFPGLDSGPGAGPAGERWEEILCDGGTLEL